MNITIISPVVLCNICLSDAGIMDAQATDTTVVMLPTANQDDVDAVRAYVAIAAPCPHGLLTGGPQIDASDEWLDATALLAAIPAGAQYDIIRARYVAIVATKLAKAVDLGGII